MLDGVTVLNTIPAIEGGLPLILGWICCALGLICLVLIFVLVIRGSDFTFFALLGTVIFLGLMMMFWSCLHSEQYKVTIDDTVSVVEFNEHYKVLDQEGLIYTVELK